MLFAAVGCVLLIALCEPREPAPGARRRAETRNLPAGRTRGVGTTGRVAAVDGKRGADDCRHGVRIALANGAIGVLVRLSPVEIRGLDEATIDRRSRVQAAVAAGSAVAFGMVPALRAARNDPTPGCRRRCGRALAGRKTRPRGLVVAETAIGVVLLVAAGLLLRNFNRLLHTSPGFDTQHVVTARFRLPDARYRYLKQIAFYEELLLQAAIPGVQAVAATAPLPLSGSHYSISVELPGRRRQRPRTVRVLRDGRAPATFTLCGCHFSGPRFQPADNDGAPRVAVVNESFARTYFADRIPSASGSGLA